MIGRKDPVSAGRVYEFRCQAVGARPPPVITWWRGSAQLRENVTNKVRPIYAKSTNEKVMGEGMKSSGY